MNELFGRLVEERRCPRCDDVRAVRLGPGDNRFCLECGHNWNESGAEPDQVLEPLEFRLLRLFESAELARLRTYRAAVRMGFYRDW